MSDWYMIPEYLIDIVNDNDMIIHSFLEIGKMQHYFTKCMFDHIDMAAAIRQNMELNSHLMEIDNCGWIITPISYPIHYNNSYYRLLMYLCYDEISAGFMKLKYPYLKFDLLHEHNIKNIISNSDLLSHPYESIA